MHRSPLRRTALIGLFLAAPNATADVQFFDFSSVAGLQLEGATAQSGNRLRLVPAQPDLAGAAWFETKQRVDDGFTTTFVTELDAEVGGDGFAFVIQNDALDALGGSGCELGYDGIANSLAIEFDTVTNDTCSGGAADDPSGLHVSVHTLGTGPNSAQESASLGSTIVVPDFAAGSVNLIRIDYTPGALKVFVNTFSAPALQVAVDIAGTLALDAGRAWVGFTASTSAASEDHDLVTWTLTESTGTSSNTPPAQPTITEPAVDGQVVNPTDVHMETTAFSDGDAGDTHVCSDFEIWTTSPVERVWSTSCIRGVEKLHSHLGDGVFENSHAGRSDLIELTEFVVRVRHRDSSGDAVTEWSPWADRRFVTGAASTVFPLLLEDVATVPAPTWIEDLSGFDVVLPSGSPAPTVAIESGAGDLLLQIAGLDGVQNAVTNPDELDDHLPARVRVNGGNTGVALPTTNLTLADEHCDFHTILLPAVQLGPNQEEVVWVSSVGATYFGDASQTEPDFSSLARGSVAPWLATEPGYEVTVFATGFELPVNVAFLPNPGPSRDDPYFYVTELYGDIKTVTRAGAVSDFATNLLDYTPTGNFPGSGEQGLAGIAVDPVTGDVFAGMLRSGGPGVFFPKIVRLTSTDGGMTAATQTTILDMPGENQGQSHFISNLTIHPDGKLIAHMGDGFDAQTALDLDSFRGKILRLNFDGSPADDNPFYDASDGITARDYVLAYGLRNPFGGAWRAADGLQYQVENGPSVDRFGRVVPGASFFWDGQQSSMFQNALYNWQPSHAPVNIAFIQLETFGGSGYPQGKWGHAFVTESGPTYALGPQFAGKRIVEFKLDADGTVLAGPTTFLEYAGTGRGTACGLAAGPDGLYMTDLYADDATSPTDVGASVYRLRFTGDVDCNANGVHDGCDIASGVSLDADGNGVPDECECAGSSFCSASPNSTGAAAAIAAAGDCSVAANAFALSASPVPDQPGLFFYGPQAIAGVPFFDGTRCVGGAMMYRLPLVVGESGLATSSVDFTSPPAAAGLITPGSTWSFQYLFRDPAAGGAGANLSDGVTVSFE